MFIRGSENYVDAVRRLNAGEPDEQLRAGFVSFADDLPMIQSGNRGGDPCPEARIRRIDFALRCCSIT
jgi:hypothetical protein